MVRVQVPGISPIPKWYCGRNGVSLVLRISCAFYKKSMNATNRAPRAPEIGALLRREGLYSSQLTDWRRERASGQLQGLSSQKRGRPRDEQATELVSLRQENEQLKAQLAQADLIMAAQKKLAQALEQTLTPNKGVRL